MLQTLSQQPLPFVRHSISGETKQARARDMYLEGNKTQTAIATELGVHPKTLSYWIKQNNWREVKAGLRLAPIIIKQNLYAQIHELQDHILNREEGNRFPDRHEVMMQYKLVTALFKFPDCNVDEFEYIYKDLLGTKELPEKNLLKRIKHSLITLTTNRLAKFTRIKKG